MFPTNEELSMRFVAYLAQSIKHSSIKCYLVAVHHLHIQMGYELDMKKLVAFNWFARESIALKGIILGYDSL